MASEDSGVESQAPSAAARSQQGGREGVLTIMKEMVRDLRRCSQPGSTTRRDVSTLQRYRDVIVDKAPRVNTSLKLMTADLVHWMNRGGQWRAFLILSTGLVTLVSLTGVFVFLLFLIIATVNTVILALLGSVAAVGAVIALFFAALTAIYVGVLTIATCVISTIVFFTVVAVLTVAGWIAFWWVVWLGVRKFLQVAHGSLAFTASTLQNVSAAGLTRVPVDRISKEE